MRYMLAFNNKDDILLYWDEPTITLDRVNHKYHEILQKNWNENEIPNIILSSATLPDKEKIRPFIQSYKMAHSSGNIYDITSYEFKKTITLLDKDGYIILPHLVYDKYE